MTLKFQNERVFADREIDYVIDNVLERTHRPMDVVSHILGHLSKLLPEDQQKILVASLNDYVQSSYMNTYEWTPVPESKEDDR